MPLKSHKQLEVWKKSMTLVEKIYELTAKMSSEERYVLVPQVRRSAISIPSNIAEGYQRKGTVEYLNFLSIARASAAELETQLLLAKRLYTKINYDEVLKLVVEVQKMLWGLQDKLKNSSVS